MSEQENRRIVVVGYEPGEVIGPFADRDQAYEWIMREHSTNGLNDFDILELRAPDEPRLKWADYNAADEALLDALNGSLAPWRKVGEDRDPLPAKTRLKWLDMFGIDPDYCGGKPVDEWLEENRGEA